VVRTTWGITRVVERQVIEAEGAVTFRILGGGKKEMKKKKKKGIKNE